MQTILRPTIVINQQGQLSGQTGCNRPPQLPALAPGPSTDGKAHMPIEIPNSADSIAPTHALGQSSSDGVVARLSDREKLAYYERVIEQSVSLDPQRNEALFEIHEQKLYLLTHASFARYVDERWDLSCSRAHQIIRFVKLRRLSESSGQPPPVNERQARRLGAKQIGQDDYHRRFHRVTTYLRGKLRETPAAERERFTQDLRTFLKSLAQAFERLLPPPGKPAGSSQIER